MRPWIGVDLDGTLAKHNPSIGTYEIGEIVEPMKQRVLEWLAEGICDVKIFTARAGDVAQKVVIHQWLRNNGLPELEVTNAKDFHMVELYDDRAVQVLFNTGELLGESTMHHRQLLKKHS